VKEIRRENKKYGEDRKRESSELEKDNEENA
jgi:hypothetical protein